MGACIRMRIVSIALSQKTRQERSESHVVQVESVSKGKGIVTSHGNEAQHDGNERLLH